MNWPMILLILQQITASSSLEIFKEFSVDLTAERHRAAHTEFCFADTNVERDYGQIPPTSTITRQQVFGRTPCAVSFQVNLLKDFKDPRTVCLFKAQSSEVLSGVSRAVHE